MSWTNTVKVRSTKLEDLRPDAAARATQAIKILDGQKIAYHITSTTRPDACQFAYYAQGRKPLNEVNALRKVAGEAPISESENSYVITQCDGIDGPPPHYQSPHQQGRALDIAPDDGHGNPCWPSSTDPRWYMIASAMKQWGFTWGGDWKDFQDLPHYEIPQ